MRVPITIEETEDASLICLEGEVGISSAAEVKCVLINALSSQKQMRVSLEKATELDVTALQLLYATEREAAKSGVQITHDGSFPAEIAVAMSNAGFATFQFQS